MIVTCTEVDHVLQSCYIMAASVGDLKGYDHQFVEPPSNDLLCLICLCVARDPQQINCCGKLLCKGCLEEHKECSGDCPQCRKPINTFSDKRSKLFTTSQAENYGAWLSWYTGERDILSLNALCDNTSSGCEWVGELRSLDEHLASCDFTLLSCPNECHNRSKVVKLLRKDMEKHTKEECPRRQYECPHCQEAGEYREMTTKHLHKCPMIEIPCPKRRCTTRIVRRDLPKHRQECLFEKVPCKYSTIGCEEEVERKDLAEHEGDSQQHLQLAVDTVHQQQIKIGNLQAHSREMPMLYNITNFNQHKVTDDEIYSPAFYTSPKGYKMCIGVFANGDGDSENTHVSVYVHFMKGENDDYLPWPFAGKVTIKLLNQLEDKNHLSRFMKFTSDNNSSQKVVDKERAGTGWGWGKYISHSDLGHNTAKNCQYLKDDRLHFKISVDAATSSTPWLIL